MNYICRKDREQTEKTFSSLRRSGKSYGTTTGCEKHYNVEVKWLWLLWNDVVWILMNLMGMSLVAGVECIVQQPRENHGDVDS